MDVEAVLAPPRPRVSPRHTGPHLPRTWPRSWPAPGRADTVETQELARRGVRGLAVGAVALVVAAVTAAAGGPDGPRPAILTVGAVALLAAGAVRGASGRWRSASATSAVVAGAALAILAARSWLGIGQEQLAMFLLVAGAFVLAAGMFTDERRLTALALVQWAVAAGLPGGDPAYRHCLVATGVAVPVPRLDSVLILAVGALLVGSAQRWTGWRPAAGRGVEVTGLVLLLGALVAKGAELPGLPVLCGTGDATDAGWLVLALVAGLGTAAYGLATGDTVWAAAGPAAVVLAGLVGTALDGSPVWATVALVPVAAGVAWCERRGIPWPTDPGYRRRAPWGPDDRHEDRGRDG